MNDNGITLHRSCDAGNRIILTIQFSSSSVVLCWRSSKLRHSQDMKLHIDCNLFKHATIIFNLYRLHLLLIVMKLSFVLL